MTLTTRIKRWGALLLVLLAVVSLMGCQKTAPVGWTETASPPSLTTETPRAAVPRSKDREQMEAVVKHLKQTGELPDYFITKNEARAMGWQGGSLSKIAPGKAIGGDRYMNFEKLLPVKKGRLYYECDIGTLNKPSRGAKRLVFSNDKLYYYTEDHYENFTKID